MLHIIDLLENEIEELIDFGNQMLDSLALMEKFGGKVNDFEVILDNVAYVALLIEEKEDELEELAWRQFGLSA